MSNTITTNTNNSCIKYSAPKYPLLVPKITSLSTYFVDTYKLQATNTPSLLIYVFGTNFTNYSMVVINNIAYQTIFNGSTNIAFYVPNNIPKGKYIIEVINSNMEPNPGSQNSQYLYSNAVQFDVI
jgi:hypothetical protein